MHEEIFKLHCSNDFMDSGKLIKKLKSTGSEANRKGMARFGIKTDKAFGVNLPVLRAIAKEIGRDHELALKLWDSDWHEAKLLASMIADPKKLTEKQMEKWVLGIDSWDVCDITCGGLFWQTDFAERKVFEWVEREEEFVRRTGFVLIASFAVKKKDAKDFYFNKFFPLMKKYAFDERNYVWKAVNWSLRQVGKRNLVLNKKCIKVGEQILKQDTWPARKIANDALRELRSEAVQTRLNEKEKKLKLAKKQTGT